MNNPASHPYSWIMLIVSWGCAIVGAIAGPCVIFLAAMQGERVQWSVLFYSPIVFGGIAYMVGMAGAFLFAPTKYLESESGQRWLKMVGVSNILVARIVCAILASLALGLFIAIAVAFINEK